MSAAAVAALALIDALVRIPARAPKEVGTAAGAELRAVGDHPTWTRYEGRSATGPFRSIELRAGRDGSGAMVILREPVERITARMLDLERYGPRLSVEVGPPNASTWSARYARDGVELAFTFRATTDELVSVVIGK